LSSFPKKFLDVDHALLKDVRLGQHPEKLRLVLTFPGAGLPPYRLEREAGRIAILIGRVEGDSGAEKKGPTAEKMETEARQAAPEKTPPERPAAPAPPAKVPEERRPVPPPEKAEAEKPAAKIYTGEKITLDFIEADIRRVLALISEAAGRPIAPGPEVQGTVTLRLVDVPWDQALDAILSIFNLRRVDEGNLIRILPRSP
jgi:type IV pilus assembly protein PilQ